MAHPSRVNETAFGDAVGAVTAASARLLDALVAAGAPRDREADRERARQRWQRRAAARP